MIGATFGTLILSRATDVGYGLLFTMQLFGTVAFVWSARRRFSRHPSSEFVMGSPFPSRGECQLPAVTITKDHPLAAAYTDAVNTFYGRGNVPIGVLRNGATREQGRFIGLAEQRDGDALRYPHSLQSGEDAPEATALLRRILAAQPDGSVVFVQVGFSTNPARLLDSPADDVSPLTGRELVAVKAGLLDFMRTPVSARPRAAC